MSDIKIRVVTFCADLPSCHVALPYFMRSWKLNSGPLHAHTSYTIMLPETANSDTRTTCQRLANTYPLKTATVSADTADRYRNYWPLSFLDETYDEDLVIYCPPHTLVSHDLTALIEHISRQDDVHTGTFVDAEAHAHPLPMWFAAFPRAARTRLAGRFPPALADFCLGEHPGSYYEIMETMALAFERALQAAAVGHQLLTPGSLCLPDDAPPGPAPGGTDALFISLTDAPGSPHAWSDVFSNYKSLSNFLDDTGLNGAWLDCQRNLRRIHRTLDGAPFLLKRTLFKTEKAPYYIFALDYIQQSAGVRALHYLCHALNESGQEAYVTCEKTAPQLRTPVLTEATMVQHHAAGRIPIMVYPEIVQGNPFGAQVVARWLLNKPGHIAGDTTFAADELIFTFDPIYLGDSLRGETLHIPTSDLTLFNNENNPDDNSRQQVCFYAHKYLAAGGQLSPHSETAVSLGKEQKLSHAEIAAILRRSKLLYVYEPTALVAEALLCGCPVSIVVTEYWRRHAANHGYPTDWGVVMDDSAESLALAATKVGNYRAFYEDVVIKNGWEQIDRFIELTQLAAKAKQKAQ